jgi:GDP-L-fucose synthase
MYVSDAAKSIVMSLEKFNGLEGCNDQSKYTLNIGTGRGGMTIDILANVIKDIVGYTGEIRYNGKSPGQKEKALVVDRMEDILGWYPPTSLEEGMKKTIEWYIANKQEADKRF